MTKIKTKCCVSVFAIVLSLGVFALSPILTDLLKEDIHFAPGGLREHLYLSSPLITNLETEGCHISYYYTGGDGNKFPANGVQLQCEAFPHDALVSLRQLLAENGMCAEELLPMEDLQNSAAETRYNFECLRSQESVNLAIWFEDSWHLALTHSFHI